MDKANRPSPQAPLFCPEPSPTPRSADETPAPSRDPPAEPPASAPVAACPARQPCCARPPRRGRPARLRPRPTSPSRPRPPPRPHRRPPPPSSPPRLDIPDSAARALEACRPLAQAVVLRIGVPARDAPDVVQKLLIALLPTWVERASWPPGRQADYVAAAARIVARRYLWTAARRPETLAGGDTLRDLQEKAACHQPANPSAEELLLAHEAELELLGDTLLLGEAELPGLCTVTAPAFWRVFYAYSVLGLPVAIIAEQEGAPIPTVYNRLRLARRDLRDAILRRRAAQRPSDPRPHAKPPRPRAQSTLLGGGGGGGGGRGGGGGGGGGDARPPRHAGRGGHPVSPGFGERPSRRAEKRKKGRANEAEARGASCRAREPSSHVHEPSGHAREPSGRARGASRHAREPSGRASMELEPRPRIRARSRTFPDGAPRLASARDAFPPRPSTFPAPVRRAPRACPGSLQNRPREASGTVREGSGACLEVSTHGLDRRFSRSRKACSCLASPSGSRPFPPDAGATAPVVT